MPSEEENYRGWSIKFDVPPPTFKFDVTPNFDTNSWSAKAAVVSEPDSSGITNRLTSDEFQPENYEDEYRIRVLGMLDEKAKGRDIVIGAAPAPKRGQVIDIMEALKRSMERVPAKKKLAAAPLTRRKRDRVQLLVASTRRRSVESNRLKTFRSPNLHFCQ